MEALQRLKEADAVRRLWARDPGLFSDDAKTRSGVSGRLGWLGLAGAPDPIGEDVLVVAAEAAAEDITDIVLLGMGGSSLAPLVMARMVAGGPEHPRLHVLDTTAPLTVTRTLDSLKAESTFVVVASKSGGTIEPMSLYAIFREWIAARVGVEKAGRHFIAVTDPGTSLEEMAADAGFRAVLHAPPDVGGRFSALTAFGLGPASLVRADVAGIIERARLMERECRNDADENPGAHLAAFLADSKTYGRDKLTLVTSPAFSPFGLWVEQLIAESTGKRGTGVVPVLEPNPSIPTGFGSDRAVVVVRLEEDENLAGWAEVARQERAVHEIVVADSLDLGGEFVRWEIATALLGHLLGIDPFDQPNVAEAKAATSAILDGTAATLKPSCAFPEADVTYGGPISPPTMAPTLGEALAPLIETLKPCDYLAVLAYLPEDESVLGPLRAGLKAVATATGRATCLELGPRYLHSTGQLHKGGPNEGVFLVLTAKTTFDMEVPGHPFTLGRLYRAQAEGDLTTLSGHGRRVVRVDMTDASARSVGELADTLVALARL